MVSPSIVKPRLSRVFTISSRVRSMPRNLLIHSTSSFTVSGVWSALSTSMTPSTTSPQPSSSTNWHIRSRDSGQLSLRRSFSYRAEASVRIPRALAVSRTLGPLKQADSNTTVWVSSIMPEYSPPMTPATATALASSEITSMLGFKVRSTPSRVTMVSASFARRTVMALPSMYRRSKA